MCTEAGKRLISIKTRDTADKEPKKGPVAQQNAETRRRANMLGGTPACDLPRIELPTSTPTSGASS